MSAFSQAVLEQIPDAQQASSVANALLVAVLQSLASWRLLATGTNTEHRIGQHILGAVNHADLSGTGHVQVQPEAVCAHAVAVTSCKRMTLSRKTTFWLFRKL